MLHGWPPQQSGGTELYVEALREAQRQRGWEVQIFVAGRNARAGRGIGRSFRDPEVEQLFEDFLQKESPDRVHVHHLTGLSMGLPQRAKKLGIPVIFTLHDWWLGCARGQRVDRWGQRCAGPEPGRCAACALPLPLPGMGRPGIGPRLGRLLGRPWVPMFRERELAFEVLKGAVDLWISPSLHLGKGLGLPAIHLPLPLLRPLSPAPSAPPGPLRLLFAGSMIPTKGPQLLLQAFEELSPTEMQLRLLGSLVPYEGRMDFGRQVERRASALGLHIRHCSHSEMEVVLAGSDVLVFPSTWEENSPSILREAAAMGLPVVASDLAGVRELVPEARLFPVGEVEGLKQALLQERHLGRRRLPPRVFPTMGEHVLQLEALYGQLGGR